MRQIVYLLYINYIQGVRREYKKLKINEHVFDPKITVFKPNHVRLEEISQL